MAKKIKKEEDFNIQEVLGGFMEGFLKTLGINLIDVLKERAKKIVHFAERQAAGMMFIVTGVIFVFVGIAKAVEVLMGVSGFGFVMIGLMVFVLGVLMKSLR